MPRRLAASVLLFLLPLAGPARGGAPGLDAAWFERLRAADARLAGIAHRLVTANVALCDRRQPAPGLVLHALDQYAPADRATARAAFGFERPVAVEAVVPGTAAEWAAIRPDDAVAAVNGRAIIGPADGTEPTSGTRDAAVELLADQPADAPLRLELVRGGAARTVEVPASPGCRAAFELVLGRGMVAKADGRIVQIGVRFLERYGDEEVAAVVAHELAHVVLRHRARLEAAGVRWGLLAEFGRNGRLFRRTEDEADLLGLHLLRNAGWDPRAAASFWRERGGDVDHGIFRSRTHASSRARAAALEAELARLPAGAPIPYAPPVLAERERPLR